MFKKVAFTLYHVTDMQRARKFYEDLLQLQVTSEYVHDDGTSWLEFDFKEGGCLALSDMVKECSPSSTSSSLALEVEDLEALMTEVKNKNIEVLMDVFTSPVCRLATIKDSEGNSLILHQLHPKE